MNLQLFDTGSGQKRPFEPLVPGRVTMYVCGPTVYNYAHIGNARPPVVFDVLARLLRTRYDVTYVRNITDVDDKINRAAKEQCCDISVISSRYRDAYNEDMAALGVLPPDIEPHATDHIGPMCDMISDLIENGHAYAAEGHVLFDVASFDDYGALSGRDLRQMIAGARVEVAPYKKNPQDFVLWKPAADDEPGWESPWGRGRPGWHLECSAMIRKHLGEQIDIHGGGQDLVFPHHENERAQSMCAHGGRTFVNFWLHNGFLSMNATKMSKSLGNVLLVRDLVQSTPGEAIRLALLSAHYRQPLDWTDDTLVEASRKLDRLYGALGKADQALGEAVDAADQIPGPVLDALCDDLNTPKALAALFEIARELNRTDDADKQRVLAADLRAGGNLIGLLAQSSSEWFAANQAGDDAKAIEALIAERAAAKAAKDFATADRIRDDLAANGIRISDGPDGTTWQRTAVAKGAAS
ncbi:MAG: cysteine--tRNA ligase [Pseudomonadota bacterium]